MEFLEYRVGFELLELFENAYLFLYKIPTYMKIIIIFATNFKKSENLSLNTKIQRDRRPRALLKHQNFDFLFYLGWSGCFTQSKHNIMEVLQS